MADYTVMLEVKGASERDVEKWQDAWNDGAGGKWGKIEKHGSKAFSMPLEIKDKKKAIKSIEATKEHDPRLVKFAISDA